MGPEQLAQSASDLKLAGQAACASAQTPAERHQSMTWAQRLKRVFQIDIEQCRCSGKLKIIAGIEGEAIHRILEHRRPFLACSALQVVRLGVSAGMDVGMIPHPESITAAGERGGTD